MEIKIVISPNKNIIIVLLLPLYSVNPTKKKNLRKIFKKLFKKIKIKKKKTIPIK